MREQLLLLLELQKIDSRVKELRDEIEAMPRRLAPLQADLDRLETMLQAERDRLAETETWRKEQEALIQLEEEAIKKAKVKLQSAKNSRDYSAASRELDNKRKSKSEREDEVLKVMDALEKSRAEMASHEEDVGKLREHIGAEAAKIEGRITELDAEATSRSEGREDLVGQVEPKLLARYEKIMAQRGQAVVPVVDGVCGGCHMGLPPQLSNVLAAMESVEACPRCRRMLYRQDFLDQPAAE